MLYSRRKLIDKGYAKQPAGAADADGRISKFDKKVVGPFIKDFKILCEKYNLTIDSNLDGTLVLVSYNETNFGRIVSAEVDVDLPKGIENES